MSDDVTTPRAHLDFRVPTTLGRTGLRVGRLGVGSSFGVGAPALERAFHDHGVNFFYWGSIRRGGMKRAVRNLAPRYRDDLVVTLQSYDRTGPLMEVFVRRGLRALRLDYADVLLLGWHNAIPSPRVLEAAVRLRDAGLVRWIALSSHHRPVFAHLTMQAELPIDIFMVRYNAAHRGAEREVFPFLPDENRPGVIAYTATRWGHLLSPRRMPAGERPLSSADCYRFALSQGAVDVCLCGPKDDEQMRQALVALDRGPLTPEERRRIEHIGDHVHGRAK